MSGTRSMRAKRRAFVYLDANAEAFRRLSDAIFCFGELGMQEHRSAELMCALLAEHGFEVERNPSGFATGFVATTGTGSPVVAIHTEYDANPTNSQRSGVAERSEIVEGAPGHCEGHNVNAAVMVAAAIALAGIMRAESLPGRLKIVGAPAEEQLVSRPYFVRDGYFDDVDVALHPHILDRFDSEHGLIQCAAMSVDFVFHGQPAHASAAPWDGRDALDALVLMDAALAQHREHMRPGLSMHRVVTAGGDQPNVIPARTSAWWYFRGPTAESVAPLFEQTRKCAEGACLMTGCTFETRIRAGVWPVLLDRTVARVIHDNIAEIGMPEWTAAEQDFARRLQKAAGKSEDGLKPAIAPFKGPAAQIMASNDCGDVSWKVPMGRVWFPANVPNLPFHHWAAGAALCTPIAHKGGLAGAKALAGTVIDYLCHPALLEQTKASFAEATAGVRYAPLIELDQAPPADLNRETMERFRPAMEAHYRPERPQFGSLA